MASSPSLGGLEYSGGLRVTLGNPWPASASVRRVTIHTHAHETHLAPPTPAVLCQVLPRDDPQLGCLHLYYKALQRGRRNSAVRCDAQPC